MLPKTPVSQKNPLESWDYHPIYPVSSVPKRRSLLSRFTQTAVKPLSLLALLLVVIILIYLYWIGTHPHQETRENVQFSPPKDLDLSPYLSNFEVYLKKFNKKYSNTERKFRFNIYLKNMLDNEKRNSANSKGNAQFGETIFSDRTEKELRNMLIASEIFFEEFSGLATREAPEISANFTRPGTVDWREKGKVTRVKDQGNCGSCWAFGTVAAVEAQVAIGRGENVELSEQQLIDCDKKSKGCDGGYTLTAALYVLQNGLHTEDDYPYSATDHHDCRVIQSASYRIDNAYAITKNEAVAADWVALHGPVTIGMLVTLDMMHYSSGVFDPSPADCSDKSKVVGGHAMAVVGYGNAYGVDYWLVKNSWSPAWGQNGYMLLRRGVNACQVGQLMVAPLIGEP